MQIERAAERNASLTRQLLAFSRRQVMEPRILDLNTVIGGLEPMFRRLIGEHIRLEMDLQSGLGTVRADPGQVEQIVMNLLINARDAMPEGGRIRLSTANVELETEFTAERSGLRPGPHALLEVSDTGHGMDAATLSRIFEPFFTTKEFGRGSGLGLSTVYGIVKQSGGHIEATSEPGVGSCFRVYLPRVEGGASPEVQPVSQPVRRGHETILLVEDEDSVRELVSEVLTQEGYRVFAAADGEAGMREAALHAGEIQLLITDIVMPGMNGLALARGLAECCPGSKVLLISGYAQNADSGDIPYLQKPFGADVLTRKTRALLDGETC